MTNCTILSQTAITMGDLPTWLSAAATIFLVVVTYKYVRLVKAQSDAMVTQSKVMEENTKREQIRMKYARLAKEMDDLIGPLYSKMDDNTAGYFTVVTHSNEFAPHFQEMFSFWRDIKKNVYLAPKDLRESLSAYLDARQLLRTAKRGGSNNAEERFHENMTSDKFYKILEDLKPKIKDRYLQLSDQLEECEKEFSHLGIKP
jgi:hemerythrin-like domain-containing protein